MADPIIQYIICLLLRRWHELLVQKSDSLFRKAKSFFNGRASFFNTEERQHERRTSPSVTELTPSLPVSKEKELALPARAVRPFTNNLVPPGDTSRTADSILHIL